MIQTFASSDYISVDGKRFDVLKFILAIFVVGIHTLPIDFWLRPLFRRRVLEEDVSINDAISTILHEQLSPEERKSVSLLAYSIKKAAKEVRTATLNHTHVGRLADDFLSELAQDEA